MQFAFLGEHGESIVRSACFALHVLTAFALLPFRTFCVLLYSVEDASGSLGEENVWQILLRRFLHCPARKFLCRLDPISREEDEVWRQILCVQSNSSA